MNFPIDLHLGDVKIDSHFLLEMIAYTAGFRYYLFLKRKQGDPITTLNRAWILFGAALGALVGSRLLGVFDDPTLFKVNAGNPLFYFSSQTIVGGLLGGLAGTEITKKLIKVNVSSGDLIAFPIMLAMMIGRVGCFLAGLEDKTYGVESSLPWAVDLGDGIARHPTSLYEIVFLGLLWIGIVLLEKKMVFENGTRFKLFLFSYLIFRLLIEFIKPVYVFPFGLSSIQIASIAGIMYYYKIILYPKSLFSKFREVS